MSKDKNIADIVKQLDKLSIDQTEHILNYIEATTATRESLARQEDTPARVQHLDKDGQVLKEGDTVVLLTSGVDNHKYEEGKVKKLPKKIGDFLFFIPKRFYSSGFVIRKKAKSVRKVS